MRTLTDIRLLWLDKDADKEIGELRKLLGKNSLVFYEMDTFTAYIQYKPEDFNVLILDASQDEVFSSFRNGAEQLTHFSERWKNKNENLYIIATSVQGQTFSKQDISLLQNYNKRINLNLRTFPRRKDIAHRVYQILKEDAKII
jgi:hypothetical protein